MGYIKWRRYRLLPGRKHTGSKLETIPDGRPAIWQMSTLSTLRSCTLQFAPAASVQIEAGFQGDGNRNGICWIANLIIIRLD
jgi:hypothetical protein